MFPKQIYDGQWAHEKELNHHQSSQGNVHLTPVRTAMTKKIRNSVKQPLELINKFSPVGKI